MLTRRFVRSSVTSQLFRAFTTSASLSRTPSISDITPQGVTSFDAKQKEFRDRIAEQSRKKDTANQTLSGAESANGNGEKKGKLSSLIYGTPEGREMEKEIEQSFSQVLARGKYVHSIVFHQVKPDKVDEYVKLVGEWYPRMAGMEQNKVHLVGSWRTEVGDCDTFGRLLHFAERIPLANVISPYLGIPTLSWIPRLPP
ncbi:hypothetical protein ACMFMF_003266 [Clarireedia jacksonii]